MALEDGKEAEQVKKSSQNNKKIRKGGKVGK